jgi:glucose/arabinose dehydrogenase
VRGWNRSGIRPGRAARRRSALEPPPVAALQEAFRARRRWHFGCIPFESVGGNTKARQRIPPGSIERAKLSVAIAALATALSCKSGSLDLDAVDQAATYNTKHVVADAIQVPDGFRAVVVAEGFTYPSSIVWDSAGTLYVLESHTVPIPTFSPRILRVSADGKIDPVKLEGGAAPTGSQAIGLAFHDGWLYWSHEEKDGTWGISRVRPSGGEVAAVLRGLPARGDHGVNYLVFGGDGSLYFGIGSATNLGVVSSHDPVNQKWLEKRPDARDIPCRDIVLTGAKYTEEDALPGRDGQQTSTGVYQAYGQASAKTVQGEELCTGAVYRLAPGGDRPELLAWGFRNPVALALDPDGNLLVGMHGADMRSQRPIQEDPDALYRLRKGTWYGWPDFAADLTPAGSPKHAPPSDFRPPGMTAPLPVTLPATIDHGQSGLELPARSLLIAATDPHAAVGGMTVVPPGGPFAKWAGQALLSEMGDFKPTTDPIRPDVRAGFQVEAVDLRTGRRTVFARNRGTGPAQPASHLDLEVGFERPVDVKVGPDGLVYVLDFGVFNPTEKTSKVLPKTGKLFRIEPTARPAG